MMDKSLKLKNEILSNYKSIREFSNIVGIPNSTLVSALDNRNGKGIGGMAVEKVIKICDALNLDVRTFDPLDSCSNSFNKDHPILIKYNQLSENGKSLFVKQLELILKYESDFINELSSEQIKESSAAYAENITVLPTLVQRICAGTGSIGDDVLFEEGQYPAISVPSGSQYAAVITGNSMEPEFYDGDIIFYKKVDSLNYGDIGIFNFNDENIIKKYEKTGLHALNPEYEDVIPASDDHVVIIGKVLGKM